MRRLQDVKASFDVLKWQRAEKTRKKLLDNIKQYPEKPIPKFTIRGSSRESVPKLKPPFSIYNSPTGSRGMQTFREQEKLVKAEKRRFGSVDPRVRTKNMIDARGVKWPARDGIAIS